MEKINTNAYNNQQSQPDGTSVELPTPAPTDIRLEDPSDTYPQELVTKIVALGSIALENERRSEILANESAETKEHRARLENKNPSRKDKKKVWTTNVEGTIEKPKDPVTGKSIETPQQFGVKGIRDEAAAMRIAKKAKHHATHNAERSLLESGIFEINPETGKSKLRNNGLTINGRDASLNHLSRGMRKRVKKAEKRHKKLSKHSKH